MQGTSVQEPVQVGKRREIDIFSVVGDPVKRRLLEMTREREWSVNEMVDHLKISQPAISKHLRSLRDAGLVDVRVDGQRRWYRLRPNELEPLHSWIGKFSSNGQE